MSFQLHARILERSSERLRVRFWTTNPDSAQVLPSATHDLSSTPLFLALWLREHCAAGDALMDESARIRTEYAAFREAEVASGRSSRAALVIEEELLSWALALRPVIAGLSIHEVANHPVSKRAASAEFWRWDGVTPPEHLPRFDLDLVLRDPRWLPAKLPTEVHGTTATTLASKHLNTFRVAARSFLASHPGALAACAPHHFRVLPGTGSTVRCRFWVTSSDVLDWERANAKGGSPWRTAVPGWLAKPGKNEPLAAKALSDFVARFLLERSAPDDAIARAVQAEASRRLRRAPGEASRVELDAVQALAPKLFLSSVRLLAVSGVPAPLAASSAKKASEIAAYQAYWQRLEGWNGDSDPVGLAEFEVAMELEGPKWMPSRWPEGVAPTLALSD